MPSQSMQFLSSERIDAFRFSPYIISLYPKVVSAVLEEQHEVFVECLNEAKDMEQHHRVDLGMLWETVGLRVSVN